MTQVPSARRNELWAALDRARHAVRFNFPEVVKFLQGSGFKLSILDLMEIQGKMADFGGPTAVSPSTASFFEELVRSRQAKRVLVANAGFGLLHAWLAERLPEIQVTAADFAAEVPTLLTTLELPNLHFQQDAVDVEANSHFDAVISCGPVGLRSQSTLVQSVSVTDDPAALAIARNALAVAPNGFIAAVVLPNFVVEAKPASVRRNLERFRLHLFSALTFPSGTFPFTETAFDLVILTRAPSSRLFVGEISPDEKAQKQLIARMWAGKEGSMVSHGKFVEAHDFRGLAPLKAEERIAKLAKGRGLNAVAISEAVLEIRSPTKQEGAFAPFGDHPNAVYLPQMARTNATTRQEELPARLQSYLQLIVNPEVVLPDYLAQFFNTELGHAVRQAAMTGTAIPRISTNVLMAGDLQLPPLATQLQAVEATTKAQRLTSEVSEILATLWNYPRRAPESLAALAKVNHEDRFEHWLETLPYPLASILREYHATDLTDKEKTDRLLHFFEALAAFYACIHLSANQRDVVRWTAMKEKIAKVMADQNFTLDRPTFGLWIQFAAIAAAALRPMLNGSKQDQQAASDMYAAPDTAPLEVLASSDTIGILQRVNTSRNLWKGHGGAVTPGESKERHLALQKELAAFRKTVGTVFSQYELVEPRGTDVLPGPLFRATVRRIMGSNPILENKAADLSVPAVTGLLHMHAPGHDRALPLIPLIQVKNAPQPACYFFNRASSEGLRFVSYQLAQVSEVTERDEALLPLLSELRFTVQPED